jgi:basic membrane protein A
LTRGLTRRAFAGGVGAAGALGMLPRPASAAPAPGPLVALVHTQAAGDNGVVDGMIASLHRIGRDKGLRVRAVYASDPANFQPILELLGEAGAAVVLATFEEVGQPLKAVAPVFPATRFVQIYGDPIEPPIANLRTVAYETHLAAYLAGVCGAYLSKTGKIGYIGGASIPTINADVNAIIAGARSVDPRATVTPAFVGSFQDPAKGHDIAEQLYRSGVDFIQTESAASDTGVIESANAQPGRLVSAGSTPQFALGPTSVAAILLCDFAASVYAQISDALGAKSWTGGHYRSGLGDGVIDFIASTVFFAHAAPPLAARLRHAWPAIQRVKAQIIAGALKVPFKTELA